MGGRSVVESTPSTGSRPVRHAPTPNTPDPEKSHGIYDLTNNRGFVCIGDCFDTPRFAVEAIRDWWADHGSRRFPQAERLLILADAGGSNGCRSRVWKAQLQEQLCDACGLAVTVCH
jgi:hypothetical protein